MGRRRKINDPNQLSQIGLFDAQLFMDDIKDVIGDSIINKDRSATGKAVKSLSVQQVDDNVFAISSVTYLPKIQTGNPPDGRKRTRVGKSNYMTAPEYALADKLKQGWLQSRNLSEDLAYPIARSIVSKGDRTYQQGGQDVWDSDVNKYIEDNFEKYLNLEQYLDLDII